MMINNKPEKIEYMIEPLTAEQAHLLGSFDCGNDEINKYLNVDAVDSETSKTYIFVTDEKEIIAFVTLCCSGLCVSDADCYQKTHPAIQIEYFAVAKKLQKLSPSENENEEDLFCLSDQILSDVVYMCRVISENVVGAQFILLYSVSYAEKFYRRNLFHAYKDLMKADQIRYLDGCVPMYMIL